MFKNLKAITPKTDASTTFTRGTDWKFAADLTVVPLTRDEVAALSPEYTIVFSAATPSFPIALLGLDGKNTYVTEEGHWAASRVPERVAMYPFCTVEQNGAHHLGADANALHFKGKAGEPLYDAAGNRTALLDKIMELEARTFLGLKAAVRLTSQLEAAGLLTDSAIHLGMADGRSRVVNGFRSVSVAALTALDEATRTALTESGAMALAEAHAVSLANLGYHLPAPAPAAAPKKKTARAAKPADGAEAPAKKPAAKKTTKASDVADAPAKATRKVAAKPKAGEVK